MSPERAPRRALQTAVAAGILGIALAGCGSTMSTPAAPPPVTTEGPSMPAATASDPLVLDRLREAINSGDATRVADCFTADFQAELPHHPERNFTGAERVLANWTAIFNTAPHLNAKVLRSVASGPEIWSEWEITGVNTAGAPVLFAGPVILTTRNGQINWVRFYLEPVGAIPG
ncbi:nuclear transport factor 2 family protein [Mycolicibacterium mengxianglii]|nr:nuclear transport factor 2 family protein [Mycolicibacterium mengxianglii]